STALLLPRPEHLPADLIDELYPGSRLVSSVSRLQEFAACPFQSFARGSLGLTTRPEARVTPLETGTLAHAALDRFFESGVDRDQVSGRLRDVFEELAPLPEFQGFRLDDASRFRWDSTRRALDRFLTMELARLGASPYRVIARERSFGMGSGSDSLPGLELPLSGGRLLVLRGQIDRMDARTDRVGVHVLVIDYKRTARSGLPATLEAGVDLQLATYLIFARDVAGMVPAGGLYVPVVPSPPRRERLQDSKDNRLGIRAHGFVLEEEAAGIDGGLGFLVRRGPQRLAGEDRMNELLEVARQYLTTYGATMARGWIAPRPLLRESRLPCERCDFGTVCRYRPGRDPRRRNALEGMVSTDPHEEASAVSGESAS
ncbi:MAG: PD-(D/E)XK nuclease family protein, partial [Candidatus Eisenbacteria bacterium]|nr:PD-(D/E)XK nuclease family protein [Candidatus Eisenbacteria bacterium]